MLPLYPELKTKLEQLLLDLAHQAAQSQFGFFADAGQVRQHEGDRLEYMTVDGDEKATSYQRIGVGGEIRLSDIPAMTFEDAALLAMEKGRELGAQQVAYYLEILNQSLEEVGNVIDVGGEAFTVGRWLQLIEKMRIPFDDQGKPLYPTMHCNPAQEASVRRVREEISSPEVQARLMQITEKKKEEWDAEQDRRKLVD